VKRKQANKVPQGIGVQLSRLFGSDSTESKMETRTDAEWRRMHRLPCVALIVLGTFLFAARPLGGQADSQSQKSGPPSPLQVMERDIAAKSTALLSESKDLGGNCKVGHRHRSSRR
jgi:hypothetical protein